MTSLSQAPSQNYRTDIDGLRAIAVMLVILDHLQFRHFSGGYVGVDVFFVISGYLIGSSLIAEFTKGSFSLASFYERRIRRIFPALLGMLFVVTVLACRYLMPEALISYASSLIAAILSVSNFLFWHQAGYFDAPSAAKPLLHTWSLAVEEQFYLIFPLLLAIIFRWWPRRLRAILWTTAATSFVLAAWITMRSAPAAFFWSPLRAWELLAGALISQHSMRIFNLRAFREVATTTGLAMILIPAYAYTSLTPFPGVAAIPPCLGAVLIIAAGTQGSSLVGDLLSTSPFTFTGRISYSLYLWHWPLIVFQNTNLLFTTQPSASRTPKIILLALSFLIAALSWRLIETPFRTGRLRPARVPLFLVNGAAALVIAAIGIELLHANGLPARFPEEIRRVASFQSYDTAAAWRKGVCFLAETNSFADYSVNTCLNSSSDQKQYVLYGDSTAADLYPGLVKIFPDIHFQQATAAACPPIIEPAEVAIQYRRNCAALWKYMHTQYLLSHHPDAVVLAASWQPADLPRLGKEIQRLHELNVNVILIGPELEFDFPLPLLLSTEMQRHESQQQRAVNLTRHLAASDESLDAEMSKLARDTWHVRYISIFKDLCGQQVEMVARSQWETTSGCPLFTNAGEPLIYDGHHFTVSASIMFASILRSQAQLP